MPHFWESFSRQRVAVDGSYTVSLLTIASEGRMLGNFERYGRIAAFYDWLDLPFEYGWYRRIRPLLFQDLSGRLLDLVSAPARIFHFTHPALMSSA
jgi:hypothetical protein